MADRDPVQQREFALSIVRRLRQAGHDAYWAGGCVRDALLGRQPKDYDVATDARPPQIRELFGRHTTLDIGAAFGVVAVVGPRPAGIVEVTTFRQEAGYLDGRHPDPEGIRFTSAEKDAQRRDFTINGLFYDPLEADESRRVIDFVGGVGDLRRKVVRAIGNPRDRFDEDKLRMLRGVRFAATFDFDLDEATSTAIAELAPTVTVVSAERIAQEMRALLVLPGRARGMELLRQSGLLAVILPELVSLAETPVERDRPESENLWQRTLAVLDRLPSPGVPLALAALLHASVWHESGSVGDGPRAAAEIVKQVAERWRLSNKETDGAAWLVERHRALVSAESMPWPRLQRLLISPDIDDLLKLHAAIADASRHESTHVDFCRRCLQLPPEELNPAPVLTGDDLVRHGVPRGKHYKTLLEAVRDAQLEKRVKNLDEALALVERLLDNVKP
ncbi:MAG TPA: CCA tRNA nucleotidyltransferase [Pirellulales bacterium]|nr:CCA tRNA nucleotidyltransferase [Pirellulales bacterium]